MKSLKKKMFIIINLLFFYLLTNCSLFNFNKKELHHWNFFVISGNCEGIVLAKDISKKFELLETNDFIELLKEKSFNIIESDDIYENNVVNILVNNFNYRERQAKKLLNSYEKPLYIFSLHPYTKHWIKEWVMLVRSDFPVSNIIIPSFDEN
jgi:hypothetical protein